MQYTLPNMKRGDNVILNSERGFLNPQKKPVGGAEKCQRKTSLPQYHKSSRPSRFILYDSNGQFLNRFRALKYSFLSFSVILSFKGAESRHGFFLSELRFWD